MRFKLKQNIWKPNENGLGFYCVNVIESTKTNPSLTELLKYNILKQEEFGDVKTMSKIINNFPNYYGSFLIDKIEISDFQSLNWNGLKSEISAFYEDGEWGEDLPIFKKNFELAFLNQTDSNLSKQTFYYINAEKTDSNKLANPNFFSYLICIICTKKESNIINTLTFGLD